MPCDLLTGPAQNLAGHPTVSLFRVPGRVLRKPGTVLIPAGGDECREGTVDEREEVERVLPGWRALAESVAEELTAWRRTHPRATLTEIETVVFDVGQRLQALALQQVVQASATADVAAQPAAERPTCPTCSGQLEPRGRQRRTIRPARQRTPLELDRSYAVCAECGAGLFPPG